MSIFDVKPKGDYLFTKKRGKIVMIKLKGKSLKKYIEGKHSSLVGNVGKEGKNA